MWAIALNVEQVAIGWLRKRFWSGFRFPLVGNSRRRECNQWWAKTTWLFGQFFQAGFASEHSAQIWPVLEIRSSIHAKFAAKSTHWIYKNGMRRFASRAAFQSINDLIAQHSGQLLMFQGKSCSHGRSYTLVIGPNDRTQILGWGPLRRTFSPKKLEWKFDAISKREHIS